MHNTFSEDFFERWEHLISSVEISEIPMRFIKEVDIVFENKEHASFNVSFLLNQGYEVEKIEETIETFLEIHDEDIKQVDFHINISALAEEVGEKTNRLLES